MTLFRVGCSVAGIPCNIQVRIKMVKKKTENTADASDNNQKSWVQSVPSRVLLALFVGFSLYMLISAIVVVVLTKPEKQVRVPNVVGRQFIDVYNSISRKGLKPEIRFYDVYDIDNGLVLKQYPESGNIISDGSTLRLLVSRSSLKMEAPNLVGIELPFALNKLRNMHIHEKTITINPGVISYLPSDKTAGNIIIAQDPRPGERITPERKINLLVSTGKTGVDAKMPDCKGQSINLAYDLLVAHNVEIAEEIVQTGRQEKSGSIVSQSPAPGTAIDRGQVVKVKVLYYPLKNHPYRAFERIDYTIPQNEEEGLYEAYVEDNQSKRLRFSRTMKPGNVITFLFHRTGNSRITLLRDKKQVKVFTVNVEEFE